MSLINQICRQITDVQFPIEVEKQITDWIYTRINKSKMLRDFAGSDLLSKAREDYNDSCGMLDNILKKPMPYIRDWYYETIHNESQKGNYFTDYGNLGPTMHYFDITIPVGEGSGENGRMLKEDVIKFIRYSLKRDFTSRTRKFYALRRISHIRMMLFRSLTTKTREANHPWTSENYFWSPRSDIESWYTHEI